MTPQTKRRKFIAKVRKEAFQGGERNIKDQFYAWFRKAVKRAKKGDFRMLEEGPSFHQIITIQCCADLTSLFARAQHDLDADLEEISGEAFPTKSPFASRVTARMNEKLSQNKPLT